MAEVSAAGARDPYMQAYITARMKNQVEEMKLQKLLSNMEVSQRLRKIMINLEIFEDRKNAHRLQKEVKQVASRQKVSRQYLRQMYLLSAYDPALVSHPDRTAQTLPSGSAGEEVTAFHSAPHPPMPSGARKGVYLATKGRECAGWRDEEKERGRDEGSGLGGHGCLDAGQRWASAAETSGVSRIKVSNCGQQGGGGTAALTGSATYAERGGGGQSFQRPATTDEKRTHEMSTSGVAELAAMETAAHGLLGTNTTATSAPQRGIPRPPAPAPAGTEAAACQDGSSPGRAALHFPPVCRTKRTPGYLRSLPAAAAPSRERKRLPSASQFWVGDPRASQSVRRDRINVKEMVASMKAGEETRRLLRKAVPTCSKHCGQPDILSQLGRTYVNLPDLLPEIEKARQRLAEEEEEAEKGQPQDASQLSLAGTSGQQQEGSGLGDSMGRKVKGRFDMEEEEEGDSAGTKNLPIYHIDYSSLRQISSASRRRSMFA